MRIRSTGVGAKAFLEAFGAIPVQLPSPAVYENLQTGVIDGSLQDSLALHEFRVGEVAPNHLEVNTTAALLFLGMNKRSLGRLPADIQESIKTQFSGPEVGARASQCWTDLGEEIVNELKADGQIFTGLSAADEARAREVSIDIVEDYIGALEARGKPARAFYDALVSELSAQSE
jgi:TRAP-type C4-dicarboxylate transport system substrate-binding protein